MKSIAFKLSALVLVAAGISVTACAAPLEEDVGEDGASAFSEATCKPRADTKKAEAAKACKKENPVLNAQACLQPADTAWLSYLDKLAAARAPYAAQVEAATAECKANVDSLSAFTVVKDANPRYSDAMATIEAKDTKEVERLRDLRRKVCEVDVANTLSARVDPDSEYAKLRDQMKAEEKKWNDARRKCDQDAKKSKAANEACTGEDAWDAEMKACRRECPDLKDSACKPDGYANPTATCGKLVPKKSLSWQAKGQACGDASEAKCERTEVCDKFDVLQRNADSTNAAGGCSTADAIGIQVPEVVLKDGKASAVKMNCVVK